MHSTGDTIRKGQRLGRAPAGWGWAVAALLASTSLRGAEPAPFGFVGRERIGLASPLWTKAGADLRSTIVPAEPIPPVELEQLITRSLIITAPAVVDDPRASGTGPWSLGHLLAEAANQPVTGISPQEFVLSWTNHFKQFETMSPYPPVNGWDVTSRPIHELLENLWPGLAAGEPDLARAPFVLLAIVNRVDLRTNLVLGNPGTGSAGEARFVFGLVNEQGDPEPCTVILEYAIEGDSLGDVRHWAQQWYELRLLDPGTPEYRVALQRLTDRFTRAGAAPRQSPNRSALAQLRTSERIVSKQWEFREFMLDAGSGGLIRQVTTKQTPDSSHNRSELLARYLQAAEADLLADRHQVPQRFAAENFLGTQSGLGPSTDFWNVEDLPQPLLEARHRFSVATCNACHAGETATDFFHIAPRRAGAPASLSGFLLGISVKDPANQMESGAIKVRRFADLERRAYDLQALIEGSAVRETARLPLQMVH
jgi:hypothetical protein